jgi:hypothetical protein
LAAVRVAQERFGGMVGRERFNKSAHFTNELYTGY